MLVGLIYALVIASPTAFAAIPRLNFHEARAWGIDIQPRQPEIMCPTGFDLCGVDSCAPKDGSAVCCEDGSLCPANYNCLPNVCCPFGEVCDKNMSIDTTTILINNGTVGPPSQTGIASAAGLLPSPFLQSQSAATKSGTSSLSGSSSALVPTATGAVSGGLALTAGWALWPAAAALSFFA
ncbi:hypothetical protein CcaverHIS002_0410230 [Cutaneotrichosporon cavernicola]|uniref:Granulins domain-containing protein n=1 Tax=Cutaneotrichosporon cavernicola TaxID=279322 RepID=A0AA48QWA8_9TREE|nr:uncharacterized protein CcaverHIS019_0410130 [Cutaneotrichosporon cavernicola]BEI84419.1 hypothetical protein CcaverHIS002_0410230 [Cutaneotrichosporon cavernicola]BEI92193.1 hypothetical protein CcaverHIS019_0410130 [Cutaneotrichosporon cavernicola]BEI99964.1 hypothetical protein CcaverHIS631_0410070 [Cutaneotrichosporon cavernicola]BEJ07738.1 hypothetical protein CcaverHIS641_0410070 [Cutaneotrichosporon cavernicola]